MNSDRLHSALKTEVQKNVVEAGISYTYLRLQHGKDQIEHSLHARPNTHTTSGMQTTDLLAHLGFRRSGCPFQQPECYVRSVQDHFDVNGFAQAFGVSYKAFERADQHFRACGILLNQPEGWGFFYGKESSNRHFRSQKPAGNGHVSPKNQRMKEAEDQYLKYKFTWIEGGSDKGWTTHYRPIHPPLSAEIEAALVFVGGFNSFQECTEFDFQACRWRFVPFETRGDAPWGGNAEFAHRYFDAHAKEFSAGVEQLLLSHTAVQPFGIAFLSVKPVIESVVSQRPSLPQPVIAKIEGVQDRGFEFDVALSFAGTERQMADKLARIIRDAGFHIFYDDFYPEHLWGKNLVDLFDRIYRKDSRYCVIFVSKDYVEREWTNHERQCAQARVLKERGAEYVLPVQVDKTELPGMPPTIGYLSIERYSIEVVAEMLLKKLRVK